MTTPAPWQCPQCSTWLAPYVSEHRCDPPSAGVAAPLPVTPCGPSAGLGIALTPGSTYSTTIWSGGGGGGFQGDVPVTATNACNAYGDCGHSSCAVAARTPLRLVADGAA
jgi:hypothetical protein